MHRTIRYLASFLLTLGCMATIVSSCSKDPGTGGSSTITGKVYVKEYNPDFTYLLSEYWGADVEVFLIFGDGITYNERIWTGPDGDFEFRYMRKGSYRIYVYSKDSTMNAPSGTIAVYRDVEITENGQIVDAGTITVFDN